MKQGGKIPVKIENSIKNFSLATMRNDGNDYLIELFNNDQTKAIAFFFNCIFFINPEIIENLISTNKNNSKVIRYKKNTELFYSENEVYRKFRFSKNRKKNIKKKSKEDNLYIFENDKYIKVILDSTGNNHISTLISEHTKKRISCTNSDYQNYIISHIESNPNNSYKHFLTNIVIAPRFIEHYIDKNLKLDNKRIKVILAYLVNKMYSLKDDYFVKSDEITDEEKEFADSLIKNNKIKFI